MTYEFLETEISHNALKVDLCCYYTHKRKSERKRHETVVTCVSRSLRGRSMARCPARARLHRLPDNSTTRGCPRAPRRTEPATAHKHGTHARLSRVHLSSPPTAAPVPERAYDQWRWHATHAISRRSRAPQALACHGATIPHADARRAFLPGG